MFCVPGLISGGTRASGTVFKFCAPGLVFDGTDGVGARFHVLRSRTLFGRYRGRQGSFSSFALSDSFWALPRAPGPAFMFCAPRLVSSGIEGAGSKFHVLRSRTRFRRYRGHWVPLAYFALPDTFLAVPRASGPVLMFCAPELSFDGTRGIEGRFAYFALPDSFWAVSWP
jgi:hypothetical protein